MYKISQLWLSRYLATVTDGAPVWKLKYAETVLISTCLLIKSHAYCSVSSSVLDKPGHIGAHSIKRSSFSWGCFVRICFKSCIVETVEVTLEMVPTFLFLHRMETKNPKQNNLTFGKVHQSFAFEHPLAFLDSYNLPLDRTAKRVCWLV